MSHCKKGPSSHLSARGIGVKISAAAARSYFLLLDSPENEKSGICVLPRGSQEGKEIQLGDRVFSLRLGQPVQFNLAYSSGDKEFKPGEIAGIKDESFSMLPPAAAELRKEFGQEEQTVRLAASLTEIGTLQMRCIAEGRDKKWLLEFQLRTSGRTTLGMSGSLPVRFDEAAELVDRIFGARRQQVDSKEVRNLRRNLETILGERDDWPTAALRELFGILWASAKRRRRSVDHEGVWLNLAGFCLRPGYGYPLDDWRIQQLWQIYDQGVQYKEAQVWSEWWTLWRRVAGGLDRIAQETLLMDVIEDLMPSEKAVGRNKIQKNPSYDMEVRLVGGLERIRFQRKIDIGEHLIQRLKTPSIQTWWAIGRSGARIPFYGAATNVIPKEIAENWLDRALKVDWRVVETAAFAAMLLARKTGDRDRDINEALRARVAERLRSAGASPAWMQMVEEVSELGEADERQSFGESLPPGLRLIH